MAEEKENQSKIASMLAVAAFLSDSRRAPVCPYCGAWGNPIQIANDDNCAGSSPDAGAGAWTGHAERRALSVAGGPHAGLLAGEIPGLLAEPQITHMAGNAFSRRHDLRRRYQCCQCTQFFAA
jgi:hypothetical protein